MKGFGDLRDSDATRYYNAGCADADRDLLAACNEALGAMWELRAWESRDAYDADPAVKKLRAAIARVRP